MACGSGHTLRMYERLVRKVLQHPSQPAVLLVQTFAWRRPDARSYPGLPVTAFFESPEDDFGAVAKYYSLPSVSLRDAVFHDALKVNPHLDTFNHYFCQRCYTYPAGDSLSPSLVTSPRLRQPLFKRGKRCKCQQRGDERASQPAMFGSYRGSTFLCQRPSLAVTVEYVVVVRRRCSVVLGRTGLCAPSGHHRVQDEGFSVGLRRERRHLHQPQRARARLAERARRASTQRRPGRRAGPGQVPLHVPEYSCRPKMSPFQTAVSLSGDSSLGTYMVMHWSYVATEV